MVVNFKSFLNKRVSQPEEIAQKHNVPLAQIYWQLRKGIQVEREHTSKAEVARQIALAHLGELPDYYTRLKKAEG